MISKRWYVDAIYALWQQRWFGVLMSPLSALFYLIGRLRSWWYIASSLPVPTVVIGNPHVGGGGKTPFVIALVQKLQVRGYCVGVVTRGYGVSECRSRPVIQQHDYEADKIGDEGALIGEQTGCVVAACHDRLLATQALLQNMDNSNHNMNFDVIVFDDGLQDPRIHYNVRCCLMPSREDLGNGCLLPGGPLRVRLSDIQHGDIVLSPGNGYQRSQSMILKHALTGEERSLDTFSRGILIAGLANPYSLITFLEQHLFIQSYLLPDHHPCSLDDVKMLLSLGDVMMTWKDWIKLKKYQEQLPHDASLWLLEVNISIDESVIENLVTKLGLR